MHTHCFPNYCKNTQVFKKIFWFCAFCIHIISENTCCLHRVFSHATPLVIECNWRRISIGEKSVTTSAISWPRRGSNVGQTYFFCYFFLDIDVHVGHYRCFTGYDLKLEIFSNFTKSISYHNNSMTWQSLSQWTYATVHSHLIIYILKLVCIIMVCNFTSAMGRPDIGS